MKITLNPMDTYDLEFGRLCGRTYNVVRLREGVHNDCLRNVFTGVTGLETSLGTMRNDIAMNALLGDFGS